jgi:glycosyltransferase involved in cell wall biosynthesis
MKILQIIYESLDSPFGFGGAGVRAYEIFKRIKERHDITLLCMRYPGARDREIEGFRHVFVGIESTSVIKSTLAYTVKAAAYVRRHGADYDVIVEGFRPATPFFSRFLTNTPVILQIQGIMGIHAIKKFNPLYGLPMYMVEKIYPRLYDSLISVAGLGTDSLMKKAERYAVIPNGINSELLHTHKVEEDYILFLSRIDTYTKGLDILMDAYKIVADRYRGLRLVLAGHELDRTAELFRKLPAELRQRVTYAGFVRGEEKKELLAGAKIFVLPSRHEAHPVSILEALACQTAVVVSDLPELRYVEENGLGLAFRSGSSHDLSKKLIALLEDSALRKNLGIRGRRYASRFLWDDMALRFETFLTDLHRDRRELN